MSADLEGLVVGKGRTAAELVAAVDPGRTLTPEQEAIIESGTEPALIVAGAGSGKTETLSLRMLYLLDNARTLFGRDLAPDELLCLTFTRKAAGEIAARAAERIDTVYGIDPSRPLPRVATYNGYAAGLVAEHGLRVAVDPGSTVLTDAALWQLSDALVSGWEGELHTEAAVSTVTNAVVSLASQARDHRVSPARLKEWAASASAHLEALPKKAGDQAPGKPTQELARVMGLVRSLESLADLIEAFDTRKREASLIDFSDQVSIAVELAQLDAVKQAERARCVAVLLDEFQDTSPPQLDLFATIFGEGHPVMAVGDPHQAIYGFRGASADALADFVDRFGGPAVTTHTLTVSWRNESSILEAANAAVSGLAHRIEVPPLRSKAHALGVSEAPRRVPGVIASRHLSDVDEAQAIAGFIAARRAELAASDRPRGAGPITAAVLCRRRSQFPAIADALSRAGITFEIVGLGGLLDVPQVSDLIALIEVAHDPGRGDSLMRLITGERVALGPADLAALHDRAREISDSRAEKDMAASIVDALDSLPGPGWVSRDGRRLTDVALARLGHLARVIEAIRRHTYLPLTELVLFAERAWNLDIEASIVNWGSRSRRAVDALLDAVRGFSDGAARPTVGAMLAWLDAARTAEDGLDAPVRELDPAAVQLLTVHASKGLEWDVVVVAGLDDSKFPKVSAPSASTPFYADKGWLDGLGSLPYELRLDRANLPSWAWRAASDHQELATSILNFKRDAGEHRLAEERRLFYVALTRARSHVLLSGSWFPGVKKPLQPSMYVTELLESGSVARGTWAELEPDAGPPEREAVTAVWPRVADPASAPRKKLAALVASAQPLEPSEWAELPLGSALGRMLADELARHRGRDSVELPEHLTTSALVAMKKDRDAFALQLRRPIPVEPSLAAERGSALHAWIESLYGVTPLWEDDEDGEDALDLAELKTRFLHSEWASRVPTHVEADVEVPLGRLTIRSRIDAVFAPGQGLDRVTVVDWKSGHEPRDAASRQAREVQLAMYRLAWAAREGLDPAEVDAAFFYVADGATVFPERLLTRQELLDLIDKGDSSHM